MRYGEAGERAWSWVLDQVRWDDGPWIPEAPEDTEPRPGYRDGIHSGAGGLALVLGEVARTRPWSTREQALADGLVDRLRTAVETTSDASMFDGLPGHLAALTALGADGRDRVVARLLDLAEDDGWPTTAVGPPRYGPGVRINDLTLGTAGVLLAGVEAVRQGLPRARELADRAAAVLLAEAEEQPAGLRWRFVPRRYRVDGAEPTEMPNLSHGVAGVAAALATAGTVLDRPDLVAAAQAGAEHLLTLVESDARGARFPRYVPPLPPDHPDSEPTSFGWCHGAAGTSLLFAALDRAGVAEVGGRPPTEWRDRCLTSVRTSGLPARVRPGFWDNDGRCCGTAGVGGVLLTAADTGWAVRLGDALLDRAVEAGAGRYWRFAATDAGPEGLPPAPGWMQGAAGIAAYLLRLDAALAGRASVDPALDWWWAVR
ncbi:hypothetical protein MF406_18060 (plasmid) [Georgenia sp. TF02-10]|uniref:lanthionine synthetase LanC family protein n=1 Tax=Georgenia sp. TF02-10 TaxID=2917725 RepID=UPI001FA6CDC9|nr:lanthionine synthetase LanC family protein [Georgenia sp. TF02-10]UNX56556.1 hypothetical protein MF406_18060 [Georgenia sp. TF02-10]